MNRNKKIGILLAAVIAVGIPIASSAYSEQVKLVSKGAISYDEDGDGVEETLIDSEDLDRLMGAINEAASSQSAYASKLEELQKDLEQNRLDTDKANKALIKDKAGLVKALHSKFPGVEYIDKLTENASFEDIIAAVESLASPSSAKINYGDFRNNKATSLITSGSQEINIAGSTEINLDKNQQLVLPSGYYGSDMIINNVISGNTLNWNPPGVEELIIDRPYTSGKISTKNAYDEGYKRGLAEGSAGSFNTNATITYTVHHSHIDACYSYPVYTGYTVVDVKPEHDGDLNIDRWSTTVRCNTCGACAEVATHQGNGKEHSERRAVEKLMKEHSTINGVTYCTSAGRILTCGKSAGSYTTNNAPSLGAGDRIVSANIKF